MASLTERLDAQLAAFLSDWSLITTAFALAIVGLVLYPIIFPSASLEPPLWTSRHTSRKSPSLPLVHRGAPASLTFNPDLRGEPGGTSGER
jgi:hypothetical protein